MIEPILMIGVTVLFSTGAFIYDALSGNGKERIEQATKSLRK